MKIDKYDNVWMTDEGSGMIVKFNPQGLVTMVMGRKPEGIDYLERFLERGEKNEERRHPLRVRHGQASAHVPGTRL